MQALSDGRLTLGLAIGAREDDYEASGVPTKGRGARLSDQLAELRDWDVSPVVPGTIRDRRPELLVGGASGVAFARMARYGDGYAHGGGPPRAFASAAAKALARVERPRPPGPSRAVGPGLLRARGRGARARRTCSTTTPSPGPFAATDRRRQPHLAARDPRLRARATRRRAATSSCSCRRSPTPGSSSGWPRSWREDDRPRRRPVRPLPLDPAQEGRPAPRGGRRRAQPARRHLRLRRRVLRGDARPPARRGRADLHRDHRRVGDLDHDRRALRRRGDPLARSPLLRHPAHERCSASSSAGARELGVDMVFEREVGEVAELPEADLLVGADGDQLARAAVGGSSRRAWAPTRRASPGSAPTSRSTRSRSRSPRRSTASSRRTRIRSTSTRARSSSRRARTPGGGAGLDAVSRRRASRSAASSSRRCSTVTSC